VTSSRCTTCPRPVPDTAYGCPHCAADLARRLDELAAILPELGVTVAKQDRITSGGARASGAEVPLPYNAGAAERGRAIQGELVTWSRHVHGETGRALPRHPSGSALARYLGQAASWARYQQEWPEFHAALRSLVGVVLHLVDRPAERVYLGPCSTSQPDGPTCRADVYAKPGAPTGTCRACETVHDVAGSREWLLDSLEDVLARPAEIAGVLRGFGDRRVGYSTIAAYAASGRLVPHGQDGHGHDRYRIGDVLDLRFPARHATRQTEALAS
jgi:hypothetical protein